MSVHPGLSEVVLAVCIVVVLVFGLRSGRVDEVIDRLRDWQRERFEKWPRR